MQKKSQQIYKNAKIFATTLGQGFGDAPLPSAQKNFHYLQNLAGSRIQDIRFAIEKAQRQKQWFERLQKSDEKKRLQIVKKSKQKQTKNLSNLEKKKKNQEKKVEQINKNYNQILKKHKQIERSLRCHKQQSAAKLTKQLMQFYEKQQQKKKNAHNKQFKVKSSYQEALDRMNKIQELNEQYAFRTQNMHLEKMNRNSSKQKIYLDLSRAKSFDNRKKFQVYHNNEEILAQKEISYIQNNFQTLQNSRKCINYKEQQVGKKREEMQKIIKERKDKWKQLKLNTDQRKLSVADKCLKHMESPTKSSFYNTISNFKESQKNWKKSVMRNKIQLQEEEKTRNDKIMGTHYDLRLRKAHSFRIDEKINSMRDKAKLTGLECQSGLN